MTTWDVFTGSASVPTGALTELAALNAALPGYAVSITSHSPAHRFEAIRRGKAPGPWCVVSSDAADLWRELAGRPRPAALDGDSLDRALLMARLTMTRPQYEDLERLASRPFYTSDEAMIIVPALHVVSMIVATCDTVSSRARPCPPELVRTLIKPTGWQTTRPPRTGFWERYSTVSSGTGQKLSNQRALRADPYIEDADATGVIGIDDSDIRAEVLWKALAWAGVHVGIGAARKMGKGRFTLTPL